MPAPDIQQSILKRQVANILKKSGEGTVLTAREVKILMDYQAAQQPNAATKKTWVSGGKAALAERAGFSRMSIHRWSKFPDFPKPRANGDYCIEDAVAWIRQHGIEGGADQPEIEKLKQRQLEAKCQKIEFEMEVLRGKYILVTDAERQVTATNSATRSVLLAKLVSELPPMLEGLPVAEIQVKCKAAAVEICETLSR